MPGISSKNGLNSVCYTIMGIFILFFYGSTQVLAESSSVLSTSLSFKLNGTVHLPGESVLISGIKPQPPDRSDPGSTLVCVTTNVNTACCRKRDNKNVTNATAGAVGEWHYPNDSLVPRPSGHVVDFERIGHAHQVRLARVASGLTPPPGVYTCEVPYLENGTNVSASVTLVEKLAAPTAVEVSSCRSGGSINLTSSITLSSSLPGGAFLQVMWTGPSGTLNGSTLTGSGSSYTSVLSLSSLSASDAGTYTCNAFIQSSRQHFISSTSLSESTKIIIKIEAPSVTVSTPASLYSEGNSTSLTCTIMLVSDLITGTSLEVNWTLPDNSVRIAGGSSDATLTGNGTSYESVFTVPTLSVSLAGTYICSAIVISTIRFTTSSETVMDSAVETVQAETPSSVAIVTPSQSWLTGDSISLQCDVMLMSYLVTGTSLEVTWSLPNSSSVIAGSTGDVTLVGRGTADTSNLTIPSLAASHAGVFNCSARIASNLSYIISSDILMDSTTVAIQIGPPSSVTVSSSQSVIYELTTFTLTCSIELFEEISNFMILNVTWKGPAGATLTDTLSVSETSYTSTSTADTPGNYSCSARLVSNSEHLLSSSETINTISIVTVPAPSAPTLSSQRTPQTTTISLTWTQPPGDVVESYTVSYTRATEQCKGTVDFKSSGNIPGINGSIRSYSLTNLEEDSEYDITIEAVNGAGNTSSTPLNARTLGAAPSEPPVLRVTSATPTTISIAWDEIPCLMRNGRINTYVVSFCHASVINCQSFTIVTDVSNRALTYNNLIPRSSYNMTIRADSEDMVNKISHKGSSSSPITVYALVPQDLGFFLDGVFYPPNVAVNLADIGVDGNSLRCLTPLMPCCRSSDNPNGGALGDWWFPNGSVVYSRNSGADISRTRGASSVLLHRSNNVMSPTGVYTCKIPDNNSITSELDVYLYGGQLSAFVVSSIYINNSQLICIVIGSLVNSFIWTKDGGIISDSDPLFSQSLAITNRSTVTSKVILSHVNISHSVGMYQCSLADGNGRLAVASLNNSGVRIASSQAFPLLVGTRANLTCIDDVSTASLIQWQSEDGIVLATSNSTNVLNLSLTPVNDSASVHRRKFMCFVTRNGEIFNRNILVQITIPSPTLQSNFSSSGSLVVGSEFNLTCVSNKLFSGLTGFSTVTWNIPDEDSSLQVVSITTQDNRNISLLKFNPLRSSHSKDYTCQVSYFSPIFNVSHSIKNASVKVQISTVELSVMEFSDIVLAGGIDNVTVKCNATVDSSLVDFGDLEFNFFWRNRNGMEIIHDIRIIITSEKDQSTLTLSPPSTQDTNFTCSVTVSERLGRLLPSEEESRYISILVRTPDPPMIELWPLGNSTAGEVYSLTCDVSLSQNLRQSPVIEWVGPDENRIDNTTLRDVSLTSSSPSTTMTLSFNPLRTSHRGMYWCRATLSDTAAKIELVNNASILVVVQVPPLMITIEGSPINEDFHVGQLVYFTAKVMINPAVDTLNESFLISSWTTPRGVDKAMNTSISMNCYFSNVLVNLTNTTLDSGIYTAYISFLSDQYLMGINATYFRSITVEAFPPQIIEVPNEVYVTANEMFTLQCNVTRKTTLSSHTLLETVWLDNNNNFLNNTSNVVMSVPITRTTATHSTTTLMVSNIRTSQAGVYTCVVNMTIPGVVEDHQVRENSTVNVIIPPATSGTLRGSRLSPLYWGTSLTLTCIVNYDTQLVDTPVSFYINITGPQTNSVTTNTTANVSTAIFNPLLPVHDGSYVCSSSISPSSESLFVLPSMSASSSLLDLVLTELPVPVVGVSSAAVTEAGQFLSLICRVDIVEYLTVNPQVEWRQPDGSVVTNTGNPSAVFYNNLTLNLSFSSLLTSHAGEYWCEASINLTSETQSIIFVFNKSSSPVFVQLPDLEVDIVQEGFMIQGTIFSLISDVTIEDSNVNSTLNFSGSWFRARNNNTGYEKVQYTDAVSKGRYHRNTLTFDPLKDDSMDGGYYVFFVNVSANSSFIKPVLASANVTLVISGYPKLNISTTLKTGRCQPERGANLSSSVNILNSTSCQRNITHTWIKTGIKIQESIGHLLLNYYFQIESLTENDMGIYTVNICLTIPRSGLENHCSNISLNMLLNETRAVDRVSCSEESSPIIMWTSLPRKSFYLYEIKIEEIVQVFETNQVTSQHLSPPFIKETVNNSVKSPQLSDYVPYNVTIATLNSAKCGLSSQTICFTKQGVPEKQPSNVMAYHDPDDVTVLVVSWEPLTIVEARGFITYEVVATPSSGSRKRQQQSLRASMPYTTSVARLKGAEPSVSYGVVVRIFTRAGEAGPESELVTTIIDSPDTGTTFTIIAAVVALVVVIFIPFAIIMTVYCRHSRTSKKKHFFPGLYVLSTPDNNLYDDVELKESTNIAETEHNVPNTQDMVVETESKLSSRNLQQKNISQEEKSDSVAMRAEPLPVQVSVALNTVNEDDPSQPVPLELFEEHVLKRHNERDKLFESEYKSLGSGLAAEGSIAKLPANRVKNRFANIFPYDFSRVVLANIGDEEGSDYINANTIHGYNKPSCYVAAQGPLPNTANDFWRMIWEFEIAHIVMLTNCVESGRRKCEEYWEDGMGEMYETPNKKFHVTTISVITYADYVIRTFIVKHIESDKQLKVTHYHYTSWPDHGVPTIAISLLSFIRRVQKEHNKELGVPLLVHCSAGVGRTGTFITLDAMLERIRSEEFVNVYEFVKNMRQRRVLMVQTMAQYMFIHDALKEFIVCGNTEVEAGQLKSKVKNLSAIIPAAEITGFAHEFQLLQQVSLLPQKANCSNAVEEYNCDKNRYEDKLPYNNSRPRLRQTSAEGSDYINASFIDGYKQKNAYITTQGPLSHTVNDFWRMIWEFKSKILVTLCKNVEKQREVCHPFWPIIEQEPQKYGKLIVILQSTANYNDFEIRKILLQEDQDVTSKKDNGFILTQYQHLSWPEDGNPSSEILLEIMDMVTKAQMSAGSKPIAVMCSDGVGRSGTFLCIHSQLERLKTEGVVDMFQAVKSARIQRAYLMPNEHQYAYAHQVLADYMDQFDNYANFKDML